MTFITHNSNDASDRYQPLVTLPTSTTVVPNSMNELLITFHRIAKRRFPVYFIFENIFFFFLEEYVEREIPRDDKCICRITFLRFELFLEKNIQKACHGDDQAWEVPYSCKN